MPPLWDLSGVPMFLGFSEHVVYIYLSLIELPQLAPHLPSCGTSSSMPSQATLILLPSEAAALFIGGCLVALMAGLKMRCC